MTPASLASGAFQLADVNGNPVLLGTDLDCSQIGPGWVASSSIVPPPTDTATDTTAPSGCTYPGQAAEIPLAGIPPAICALFHGTLQPGSVVCEVPRTVFLQGAMGPGYAGNTTGAVLATPSEPPTESTEGPLSLSTEDLSSVAQPGTSSSVPALPIPTLPTLPIPAQPPQLPGIPKDAPGRITNMVTGPSKCMDTYNGTNNPGFMNLCANQTSGSIWFLEQMGSSFQLTNIFLRAKGLCLADLPHALIAMYPCKMATQTAMPTQPPATLWSKIYDLHGAFQLKNTQTGACLSTNNITTNLVEKPCDALQDPHTLWNFIPPQ